MAKVFIREPEVLEEYPFSKSTMWSQIREGKFPKPIKIGPRAVAWLREELDRHAEELIKASRGGES